MPGGVRASRQANIAVISPRPLPAKYRAPEISSQGDSARRGRDVKIMLCIENQY